MTNGKPKELLLSAGLNSGQHSVMAVDFSAY